MHADCPLDEYIGMMHRPNRCCITSKRRDARSVRPCNVLVVWLLADAQTVRPYIVGGDCEKTGRCAKTMCLDTAP